MKRRSPKKAAPIAWTVEMYAAVLDVVRYFARKDGHRCFSMAFVVTFLQVNYPVFNVFVKKGEEQTEKQIELAVKEGIRRKLRKMFVGTTVTPLRPFTLYSSFNWKDLLHDKNFVLHDDLFKTCYRIEEVDEYDDDSNRIDSNGDVIDTSEDERTLVGPSNDFFEQTGILNDFDSDSDGSLISM